MLIKNLCGFKPVLYILLIVVSANDTTERIITDKETSMEIKQETVSTVEQQKAFRMFGGSLETISRDKLLDSFLEIVKSDEPFYVMTILNFNPVDYVELGDYLGNLNAILALHGENKAWYNYLDNFGLEMVCITKPLDDKALILNEKFEDLEKIYNKLHTLVFDKFPEIAYDTIRGELIMQLQKAMTTGLAGQTKIAEQSHEELVAEAQSKVAELIESAQNYSAPDRLIEETLWHHCNKYEDPYFIETDIEDFEHSINYEQIVDVIRVKKFFLYLACNKYKEDLKKCITNLVSKFLPIIQKEENIEMFVSYYISVKQFIIQKLGYKDMPNLIHRIEKLVDKSIMHYQISKLENKLRRYFNEMLPTLQADFDVRKEELLRNQLIKNITRIFSCDETFLDIDQVQLSRILMSDDSLNEHDTIGDKEDGVDEEEVQPMLEGETEGKSKPCTIYGIRYIVIPSMSEASTTEKQQDNERAEPESRK